MADKLTPERRSWNMSRIRGKNTKPELLVRKLLHAKGYRYRLHGTARGGLLPGNPDLVFAGRRKVIFVNGCFWHFHDCRAGQHAPKNNAEFWETKRTRTRTRDAEQRHLLEHAGWEVLTVWECELKDLSALEKQLDDFLLASKTLPAVTPPARPPGRPRPWPSRRPAKLRHSPAPKTRNVSPLQRQTGLSRVISESGDKDSIGSALTRTSTPRESATMPHLLRSTTSLRPATRPAKSSPDSRPPARRRSPGIEPADTDLGPLRRQVTTIIDAILSDTKPEDAAVREKLRWHVANNPGQPEKALLSHLLSVSVEQPAG